MRNRFPREFYIPKGARRCVPKECDALAYVYERQGKFYALVFAGKAQKPSWHYSFRTAEARETRVTEFFKSRRDRANEMTARKEKAKAEGHGLEVGDILKSSWGYDQTNIDYYEVTAIIGKRMVDIRPIAAESVDGQQYMTGKCVPVPGKFTGDAMRKAARNGGVKIASYAWASKMTPRIVAGVKVYDASSWTSYA